MDLNSIHKVLFKLLLKINTWISRIQNSNSSIFGLIIYFHDFIIIIILIFIIIIIFCIIVFSLANNYIDRFFSMDI